MGLVADGVDRVGGVDGRRLRREQNRQAVLDALSELFEAGVYQPSSGEIARRAGISPRSLFRYFDDVDDLNRATIERVLERARPLLDVGAGPEAPTATKVERLVETRARVFEAMAPAARAARAHAATRPLIADQLHETRGFLRRQVARLFAPELAGERSVLLPALDALCAFETWELLRSEQRLSRSEATAALRAALLALFDGSRP